MEGVLLAASVDKGKKFRVLAVVGLVTGGVKIIKMLTKILSKKFKPGGVVRGEIVTGNAVSIGLPSSRGPPSLE